VRYTFGPFELDPRERRLTRAGEPLHLAPKTFDLLIYLVEHANQLVPKGRILDDVWRDVVVAEGSLTQTVRQLRVALADDSGQSHYIETVPRAGYRFVADVSCSDGDVAHSHVGATRNAYPIEHTVANAMSPLSSTIRARSRRAPVLVAGVALAAAAVLFGVLGVSMFDGRTGAPATTHLETAGIGVESPARLIAVLPFVNMSGDPDNEHFSDGISEEILNRLSRLNDLRVIARTSSFAFKNSGLDVPQLAAALGVGYLLQGSVRQDGRRLRITTQLVDGAGYQLWSESYDRELGDALAIQHDIAEAVALRIAPRVAQTAREAPLPHPDAYHHYLVGREILQKRLSDYSTSALEHLEQAVAIDPQFAEARAELAVLFALVAANWPSQAHRLDDAQRQIDLALALNANLARAHAAQALVIEFGDPSDLPRREAVLRRALALDPNMVDARNWLAGVFGEQERYEEAIAELEHALRLDPLAPAPNGNIARYAIRRGDVAAAEGRLARLLTVPQPSVFAYDQLHRLYITTGRLVDAHDVAKRSIWSTVGTARRGPYRLLVRSYSSVGMWEAAEHWVERAEADLPEVIRDPAPITRAVLLADQGRPVEALEAWAIAENDDSALIFNAEFGVIQALAGNYTDAIRTLEPLSIDLLGRGFYDAVHALAWAYQLTGAGDAARPLLDIAEGRFAARADGGWLHASSDLYLFAQNALLAGERDLAIDRLTRAVEAGWRGYYRLRHDPRWLPVHDDPRMVELMAFVKADVDEQRAQIERIDAEEDFAARIAAALGGRESNRH
jgi:TolB-like protein/DNA-binding winged helix-turn-helix (wHTH) protein/Tfp pilus assembly protein PilF